MKEYVIHASNLSKVYDGKSAVDQLNISIKPGEIYGFLGPNGAGKSTTVKMLVGLIKPTSGEAKILGMDLTKDTDNIRLQIGAALQETSLDDKQTGREILSLQGRLYGLSKSDVNKRIDQLLDLIDIGKALDQRVGTYSGGMKRRVDLAAALMHNPQILFLDEPTTGLDPVSRQKVWDEVRELNKQRGMTIFLTTQYLEEADKLAERIGIINQGKLIAEDTPAKLKARVGNDIITVKVNSSAPKIAKKIEGIKSIAKTSTKRNTISVYTTSSSSVLQQVVETVSKAGSKITDIEVRESSLDDVFITLTKSDKE